jgi:hypothetical protein
VTCIPSLSLSLMAALLLGNLATAQDSVVFSCPAGTTDVMKYFAMEKSKRKQQFMHGAANSIYTQVFPDEDFAQQGHWFWLKSAAGNGFDVKAFDSEHVYMRATELTWTDSSTFKRFVNDLPIAERCVPEGKAGVEIKVWDTRFQYYASCRAYKTSDLGTAVNTLDAPALMNVGGNVGQVWTRVLHYRYNCGTNFKNCSDEEQFYLANGYGIWQWKHYRGGALVKTTLENDLQNGEGSGGLPCKTAYEKEPQ